MGSLRHGVTVSPITSINFELGGRSNYITHFRPHDERDPSSHALVRRATTPVVEVSDTDSANSNGSTAESVRELTFLFLMQAVCRSQMETTFISSYPGACSLSLVRSGEVIAFLSPSSVYLSQVSSGPMKQPQSRSFRHFFFSTRPSR